MTSGLGLLLLTAVLISGYIFAVRCVLTRYYVYRTEGYGLYFYSGYCGFCLLFINIVVVYLLTVAFSLSIDQSEFLTRYLRTPNILIPSAVLTLMTGKFYATVLNVLTGNEKKLKYYKKHITELEKLLIDAVSREKLIAISLISGKEYVGRLTDSFEPSLGYNDREIRFMPILSGYRNSETKQVEYNQNYAEFYDELRYQLDRLVENRKITNNVERRKNWGDFLERLKSKFPFSHSDLTHLDDSLDFYVVIPISQIISTRIFDVDAYKMIKHFNKS